MSRKMTEKAIKISKDDIIDTDDIQDIAEGQELGSNFTYKKIIWGLTHKELDEKKSRSLWLQLLKHYDELNNTLNRDVGILVAALDFFSNTIVIFDTPTIIESSEIEHITKFAVDDSLTSLHNKRVYSVFLSKYENNYKRNDEIFSMILFDIDDFKSINDTYGHLEGDIVLRRFGEIIIKNIRESDIAFRYGGDEFAIILPKTSSLQAEVLANKLRNMINKSFKDKDYHITASFGIDEVKKDYEAKEIALNADKALYVSKGKGKNQVTIYQ